MTIQRLGTFAMVAMMFAAIAIGVGGSFAAPAAPGRGSISSNLLTAEAGTPEPVDIPSSFECTTNELGFADLLGLAPAIKNQSEVGPDASRVSLADVPTGQPVSADDFEGITETVRQLVACFNAQDPLRIGSLLSDRFLARIGLDLLTQQGAATELANYLPVLQNEVDPSQQVAMIPITTAWYPFPPDKSIYAVLDPYIEGLSEQRSFLVAFTYSDHRWVIDAVALIDSSTLS